MMSRTITLADDAYEALRSLMEPGESFSEVIRRLVMEVKHRRMLDALGSWKEVDTDEVLKEIYRWRDGSLGARV